MSGSSLVKQIAMTIVADDGDAQAKLAAVSAKADGLAKPHSLTVTADTGEATAALARYDEAAAKAAEASERLAQVQADSSSSAKDVQAAADANTEAVLRERQAWLSLGEAQTAAAIKARESADSQEKSAAKIGAGGAAADGAGHKLSLLALGAGGAALAAVDLGMKFQESSTTLVTGAGESEGALAKVERGMLAVSTQTATSSEQIQAGMYMIESAGYHGAAGLLVLKAAAEGAKVGNADLGTVADATTTILTDYKMKAGDAASATSGLVAIVASGKTHMADLASSLSRVLPTASALKVPFAQVGGAMATMTSEGITAKNAAMGLNSTMISIAAPTKAASKAMAEVGLSSQQVASKLAHGGLIAAIQEVTDAAGKKFPPGSAAYVASLNAMLGGHRGLQVALALTGSHLKDLKGNTESVGEAMHKGHKDVEGFGEVTKDSSFKVDQAKTAIKNTATQIGLDLLPALTKILGPVDKFAGKIADSKGAVEGLAIALASSLAAYALVKTIDGMKKVAGAVHDVVSGVQGAIGFVSNLAGKLTGAGGEAATAATETEALAGMEQEQALAAEEAAGAQEGLNVAMDSNPIGLIVLGITLLIGVIVLAVTHFKDLKQWALDAFRFVEHAAEDTWNWIKGHWPLLLAILTGPVGLAVLWIKDHWKEITTDAGKIVHDVASWFEKLPGMIIHGLENLGEMMYHAGVHAIEQLIAGISSMIGAVGNVVGGIAHKIAGFFGLSPAIEGPLSGEGAPEIRGAHFSRAFAAGMLDGMPGIMGASQQLAQATLAGYSGGSSRPVAGAAGTYGGGDTYQLTVNGFVGNKTELMQEIQQGLRTLKRRNGGAPLGLD